MTVCLDSPLCVSDRKICAHEASESTEAIYYNPTARPSSIDSRAVARVVGGSRASEVIHQLLLQHASERGKEAASGRGGAGEVAPPRGGPLGLVARPWVGEGPAPRPPRGRARVWQGRWPDVWFYIWPYVLDMCRCVRPNVR